MTLLVTLLVFLPFQPIQTRTIALIRKCLFLSKSKPPIVRYNENIHVPCRRQVSQFPFTFVRTDTATKAAIDLINCLRHLGCQHIFIRIAIIFHVKTVRILFTCSRNSILTKWKEMDK